MDESDHRHNRPDRWVRSLEALHAGALGIWVGSLGLTAVTAAIAFPMMRELDPTLERYAAYPGEHWRLAAGHIAAPLFQIAGWVEVVCCAVAALTLAMVWTRIGMGGRQAVRVGRWMRMSAVLSAAVLVVAFAAVIGPRMNRNLRLYWNAAEAGQVNAARSAQQAFSADHPISSKLLGATLMLALGSLGCAIVWPAGQSQCEANDAREGSV